MQEIPEIRCFPPTDQEFLLAVMLAAGRVALREAPFAATLQAVLRRAWPRVLVIERNLPAGRLIRYVFRDGIPEAAR